MKITWKNTNSSRNKRPAISRFPNLLFEDPADEPTTTQESIDSPSHHPHAGAAAAATDDKAIDDVDAASTSDLANSFLEQGNKLAEDGRYSEALGKWEMAITLMPQKAVLREQKAQVLLEVGDAWGALKAATCATELEPSWAEAWITLGRAQLNFGEPDSAVESFDKALSLTPESTEARDDKKIALHLVKKRKLLHSSGVGTNTSRYVVRRRSPSPSTKEVRLK